MGHKIIPISDVPKREFTKGSRYDAVIKSFIDGRHTIARIEMTKPNDGQELEGTYLSGRLQKRLKERMKMGKDHKLYLAPNKDGKVIVGKTINGKAHLLYEKPNPEKQ